METYLERLDNYVNSLWSEAMSSDLILNFAQQKGAAPTQPTIGPAATPDASLAETYWKLVQLNGATLPTPKENEKEIHLILHRTDSTISAFAGCNSLGGNYEEKKGNRLRFYVMRSTLMACDRIETEQQFKAMLEMVDNFAIKRDTLFLHKAKMAPLARLEAVYLK